MAAPSDKPADKSAATSEPKPEQATAQKSTAALEEDDEFEDFPVEGTSVLTIPTALLLSMPTRDIVYTFVALSASMLALPVPIPPRWYTAIEANKHSYFINRLASRGDRIRRADDER